MLVGYARVSTIEQSVDLQIEALRAAGCTKVFSEQQSGTSVKGRVKLDEAIEFVREGDVLVITRIDRLARSIGDLQDIVRQLKRKGVSLRATEQPIDTSTAAGKAFFDMLGVFAEFETNLRRERQSEGIAATKARVVYKGRKPTVPTTEVVRLLANGMRPSDVARKLGIGRTSVYAARDAQLVKLPDQGKSEVIA